VAIEEIVSYYALTHKLVVSIFIQMIFQKMVFLLVHLLYPATRWCSFM